jgi:hypothetical protein
MKTRNLSLSLAIGMCGLAAFVVFGGATSSAQDASPAASATTEAAIGKADTDWEGISVELLSVTRGDGDTLTIKFKYNNSGSKAANISQLGQFSHDNVADHVYYVDPGNKKKYLVIKDTQGKPIASNMRYLELEAGASRTGWVKVPAPPTPVSKITVYLPGAPPFESVSIAP